MLNNLNRGYMHLRVWQDAIKLYKATAEIFNTLHWELKRIKSQQLASVDSIHRNIAEGYCRKSIKEYLQFLNIALASLGESVSAIHAYREAEQLTNEQFDVLNKLSYAVENQLLALVRSLNRKKDLKEWDDDYIVREEIADYGGGTGDV